MPAQCEEVFAIDHPNMPSGLVDLQPAPFACLSFVYLERAATQGSALCSSTPFCHVPKCSIDSWFNQGSIDLRVDLIMSTLSKF